MSSQRAIPFAVVIPAYRPSAGLVDLVAALAAKAIPAIVIVDDGSGPEYAAVFARAAEIPGVELLRHAVNLGKGAALKTGINFALCAYQGLKGVVTADADGQHHPDDIERVAQALEAHPDSLVLGARAFVGDVPLRSRIGNAATSAIMHALLGRKITDTQTGLRGIPAALLPRLLRLEATGYELELEMLLAAHQLSIPILEEPIRTIYEPGNQSSHFNPVVDSMKIYFVLLRFGSVSFMTAVLDNLVFYVAYRHLGHVLAAQVLGRFFAVIFNYSMVRRSVFYSRQRHKTVLPRYLALVVASGSVSYAGIRILSAQGMAPVSAKLLIETILFFVNFAVQRLFIFAAEPPKAEAPQAAAQPGEASPIPRVPWLVRAREYSWLVFGIFAAFLALEVAGFLGGRLFSQEIWLPVGLQRLARTGGVYLALAVPVLAMVPWAFPALAAALLFALTVVSVGPAAALAPVLFLAASSALGSRLLGRTKDAAAETDLCATLLGTAVYIFLMTFAARLPVNYPAVWAALLLVPIALDWRGTLARLVRWAGFLRAAELRTWAERAALAALVFILITHWFAVLKPEASADGLSMHLAIAANIATNHALTFDPSRLLWAVMPMGADWIYSIVNLLGGESAARLLNLAMLVVVELLLYCAARRWVTRTAALLLAASFAATPLVQLVTGNLFVENLLAAMILGALTALWRFGERGERKFLYAAAALGGTALAVKFGASAFVLVAAPFAIVEVRRLCHMPGSRPLAVGALAVGIFLAAALPTYAIAWHKTGNPLFPFLNQKIHSPLLDPAANIQDQRFRKPLTWRTLFDLTFHTNVWYEGQNGSMGFQYLVLAPLGLIAIVVVRRRPIVAATVVAVGASVLVLNSEPNARYIYAALPLISIPFAALLGWTLAHRPRLYRTLIAYLVAATALDAYFLPSSSYYHKDFSMRRPFSQAERARYRDEAAPIHAVIAYFNRAHSGAAVLLTSGSDLAGLSGDVYENHWHQFNTQDRIRSTHTVPDMVRLMRDWKIAYFISPNQAPGSYAEPPALRRLLQNCTVAEYAFNGYFLGRLEPECRPEAEAPVRSNILVPRGTYDDFDPALVFRGEWNHDDAFTEPAGHTISFSDDPSAQVSLLFEGTALTYVFTKAPNRGLAELTIDGASKGVLDLYSPKVEWRSRMRFCCFTPGRHLAVLRALGRKGAGSAGQFIDVDTFVVE
jgi:glycosyltransferase involved in cell wall biosynthesis